MRIRMETGRLLVTYFYSLCRLFLLIAGSDSMTLDALLTIWRESQDDSSDSRLLLVLDCTHAQSWLYHVRRLKNIHVALQTGVMTSTSQEVDVVTRPIVGDFTADWTAFNMGEGHNLWPVSRLSPVYAVSHSWTDFAFHLPTEQDIAQHWQENFPKVTRPLLKVTNLPRFGSLFCACSCVSSCLRRTKMTWLPPKALDTGHGFKLVRS